MKDFHLSNTKSLKISLCNAEFNCRVLGNGDKIIISFHGFGQDGKVYSKLMRNCPDCTIYSFDLPYHGDTKIHKKDSIISADEINDLIKQLIDKTGISRFSIIAFSIGAKLVFPVIAKFAYMIDRIWLIAPDGIQPNFWYQLVTGNPAMRLAFQIAMKNPGIVQGGVRLLKLFKVLNPQIVALTAKSINTQQQRDRVYNTWTSLRNISYNYEDLVRILGQDGIRVVFIIGKNDTVIPASGIEKIKNDLHNAEVIWLSCGHFSLIKSFSDWIVMNDQEL